MDYYFFEDFIGWLESQMQTRSLSVTELARAMGVSHSQVSMVLSGRSRPGLDFCIGAARVFGCAPENVLRRAGLLPGAPQEETNPVIREIYERAKELPLAEQEEVLQYIRFRSQRVQQRITEDATLLVAA